MTPAPGTPGKFSDLSRASNEGTNPYSGAIYLAGSALGWSVYDLDDRNAGNEPAAKLPDTQAVLDQFKNLDTQHIVVGLPATWCLCATVKTEGLPTKPVRQFEEALAFRLESSLPITAEQCAIGFIGEGNVRLGIAVDANRLKPLVQGLEDAGHVVQAIVPSSMLAAQGWLDTNVISRNEAATNLLWRESGEQETAAETCQLLQIKGGTCSSWHLLAPTPEQIAQAIALDHSGSTSVRWHADTETQGVLEEAFQQLNQPSPDITPLDPARQAEQDAAHTLITKNKSPWINLATGPLAPRHQWRRIQTPAWSCIAAAAFLLIISIATLLFRGHQHQQTAYEYDALSRAAFTEALPNQKVPTSPETRLRSKLNQLRGQQGLAPGTPGSNQGSGLQALYDRTPILVMLRDTLAALPEEQRFVITDLRLEDDELRLTGHARSHSEADRLADAIRKNTTFTVQPPSTDNLSGKQRGVRFTLKATPAPRSPGTSPGNAKPGDDSVDDSGGRPSLAERDQSGDKP